MSCHPDLFELLLFKASSALSPRTPTPPSVSLVFPPFSPALSLFPPLVSSPCRGGKALLRHRPAADRHAKVVLWVIASLIAVVCLCTLATLL